MADSTVVDFLLENLKQLLNCKTDLILDEKDQIELLLEEVGFLRIFLKDSEEKLYEHDKIEYLVLQVTDVAYKVADAIDMFIVSSVMPRKFGHVFDSSPRFRHVLEEIKSIKTQVVEIYDMKMCEIGVLQAENPSSGGSSRANISTIVRKEETVLGFEDEAMTIVERLTAVQMQLDVISIVGMPGLGKTTLATKVYNDRFVVYHFYIRAWSCVSQVYRKGDVLRGILQSGFHLTDKDCEMGEEMFALMLYKRLKGKRYLIVLDDIWNIEAWDDLKISFPDDNNGSRIVFTSRLTNVALYANFDSPPHHLRFLTEDESWDLLQQKVFQKKSCPPELMEVGMNIAKKCKGLPLAIVVIAGLLANEEKTEDWWKHVANSVSSYIISDPEQYMDTLALSYKHLPGHLKPCFLYLGAYPEDYEIPAWKLIRLWVADGLIQRNGQKSFEDLGEDYLMDLIDRGLVLIAKRRSIGGVRACRMHDLLRDLCLRKAEEENFLRQILGYEQVSSSSLISMPMNERRLCIHSHLDNYISSKPSIPYLRSFMAFDFEAEILFPDYTSFICQAFKLLRVLDLSTIDLSFFKFPIEMKQLVHLRYLALRAYLKSLPRSISNLCYLETLIIRGLSGKIVLPYNIWKMAKLRHLHVNGNIYIPRVRKPNHPLVLDNLQTISVLSLSLREEAVLVKIPSLRKLRCVTRRWCNQFPELNFLVHLETLNVSYSMHTPAPVRFFSSEKFPPNLTKLTLSKFRLPWTEMSTLGRLPNLELLKLLDGAFRGPLWDTGDGEFGKLEVLKLKFLDIAQWNASDDHFPNLRHLVLDNCGQLKEIPSSLGDISTLEKIELYWPTHSAANSVRQIQEEQENMGNDGLKILIYPPIDACRSRSESESESI